MIKLVQCFGCNSNITYYNILCNKITNRFFYCCRSCNLFINYGDLNDNIITFFIYKNYWINQSHIYVLDNFSTDYNSFIKYETTKDVIRIESLINTNNFAEKLAIVKKVINNLEFL